MLPFQPEPVESLRARYPAAVAEVIDIESVGLGTQVQPGRQRRHVFDFDRGVRLIVSREFFPDGRHALHLSASPQQGTEVYERVRAGRLDVQGFADLVVQLFRDISGDAEPLELVYISAGKGVPHWFRTLEPARVPATSGRI